MRPEVTAKRVIEWTDIAFPSRGVHDGIHADAYYFRVPGEKLLPLHLIRNHLFGAHRVPIQWIESQNQGLIPALREMEALLHPANQSREIEVGRHFAGLQQCHLPSLRILCGS